MNISIPFNSLGGRGGFGTAGGTLTTPLFLQGNPTTSLGAAPKQYVDNKITSIAAENVIDGTLGTERFPAFTGDVVSTVGSGTINLSATGVTAGSYTKVTVNTKGRVISAGQITDIDLPNLSWTKITTDKPTTLAGYGISNGVSKDNGIMLGYLTSSVTPVSDMDAVTKSYVDLNVSAGVSLDAGDIVRRFGSTVPVGFLRCNGAQVSKTEYSTLYSVLMKDLTSTINVDYTSYSAMGGGQPWRQQYDFKVSDVSEITGWTTGTSLPGALSASQTIVTKNRVYLINGVTTNSAIANVVYSTNINEDGTLGVWTNIGTFPQSVGNTQLLVIKNKVYVIGGVSNSIGDKSYQVFVSNINTDGTLGAWFSYADFPEAVGGHTAFITKNRVYVIHGFKVFSASIDVDGNILTWSIVGYVPDSASHGNVIITKNRVYFITGQSGSIFTATINTDGTLGVWSTFATNQGDLAYSQVLVFKNNAFIIGPDNTSRTIHKYNINPDGTLGVLTSYSAALPVGITRSQVIVTKNRIHLLGGIVSGGYSSVVYTAPLSGNEALNDYSKFYDGSINKFDGSDISGNIVIAQGDNPLDIPVQPGSGKPWKQQYVINIEQSDAAVTWTTGTSLPGVLAYSQAIVTKNRVYLLGGYNAGSFVATVYTAPINADGTLGTWTTGTSLPGALGASQAVVTKNRVYLLGGVNGSYVATVYTAPINADGTLGGWTTGTDLPGTLGYSQAVVTKNRVYLLGGLNGGYVATLYTAPINADGTLGTWTTGTYLPEALVYSQAVVTKNRVYLLGGVNGSGWVATVYTAPINADGTLGTWTTGTSLPGALAYSQAVVTKNRVYLLGGYTGSIYVATVYTAPINADGTLGTWTTGTSLPGVLSQSQAVVTKNRVYLLGGYTGSSSVATVYTAPILGGLNDYSPYYDGSILPTDPNNFRLPDYTAKNVNGFYHYIKY